MKALLKLLAVLILAVALLLTLFAAWLAWRFDPDDYRDEIAALIARETGLEIEIAGPIRYHLQQGLSLSVEGLSASRDGSTLLAVQRLEADISLLGLLNRELVLRRLALKIEELDLERDAQGAFNLLPALGADRPGQAPSGVAGLALVQIDGVEIEIERGLYRDHTRRFELKAEGLALRIMPLPVLRRTGMVLDNPSLVMAFSQTGELRAGSLELDGSRLEGVEVAFGNDHGKIDFQRLALHLFHGKAGTPGYVALDATGKGSLRLGFDEPAERLPETPWSAIDHIELQGVALDIAELTLLTGDGRLDARESRLEVASLPLLRDGMQPGEMIAGLPEVPPQGIIARGASLTLGAVRLEDYALTLGKGGNGFDLVVEKGRLKADSKRPPGEIRRLSARLDGEARFLVQPRSAGKGGPIESVRLQSGALQVDELELARDGKRLRVKNTLFQIRSLPLPLGDRPLLALLERLSSQPGSRFRARGATLEVKPLRLENFNISLDGQRGKVGLVLEKGRVRLAPVAQGAMLEQLSLQLAGKAGLAFKRVGKRGVSLVADSLDMEASAGVVQLEGGVYRFTGAKLEGRMLPLLRNGIAPAWDDPERLVRFSDGAELTLMVEGLEHEDLRIESLTLDLANRNNTLRLQTLEARFPDTALSGNGEIRLGGEALPWRMQLVGERVPLPDLLALFDSEVKARGAIDLDLDLSGAGLEEPQLEHQVEGRVTMKGRDIELDGIDLDAVLGDLEKTRKIGLLDLGVFALAGPAGVLVVYGKDYTSLLNSSSRGGTSRLVELHSELNLEAGVLHAEDVAFATRKYRLAVKGSIGLGENGPLDLEIATLDPKGCPRYMEQIEGTVAKPEVAEAGVVIKGVITPITSLLGTLTDILPGGGCTEPFYSGKVAAPIVESNPLRLLD